MHIVGRKDLPVVVCVVVGIASNLLALAGDTAIIISQGVEVGVAVKVGLGLLVPDGDVIIVVNIDSICQHDVVAQGFLEFRRHEVVARAGSSQDGKVHLEPEKIEEEWQHDEANGAGSKVLSKQLQADGTVASLDIQKIPEINNDCGANGNESEEANVFGRDVAGQRKAGQDEPLPPFPAKRLMSQLVELDVEQETAGHGENQGGIEENQARLANVSIVQENQASSDKASRQAVARLPHDHIGDGHGQCTEDGGQGSESDVGNFVGDVGVADIFEVEVAVIPNQPANKGKEQLGKRRVHIEKVGALEVVGSKLSN